MSEKPKQIDRRTALVGIGGMVASLLGYRLVRGFEDFIAAPPKHYSEQSRRPTSPDSFTKQSSPPSQPNKNISYTMPDGQPYNDRETTKNTYNAIHDLSTAATLITDQNNTIAAAIAPPKNIEDSQRFKVAVLWETVPGGKKMGSGNMSHGTLNDGSNIFTYDLQDTKGVQLSSSDRKREGNVVIDGSETFLFDQITQCGYLVKDGQLIGIGYPPSSVESQFDQKHEIHLGWTGSKRGRADCLQAVSVDGQAIVLKQAPGINLTPRDLNTKPLVRPFQFG